MDEDIYKMMPVNAAIMLPSIVLAVYVIPHLLGVVYIVPFFVLGFLPVIRRFSPDYIGRNLYPAVAIFVLLLILLNLLLAIGTVPHNGFDSFLVIPLNIETAITLTMALSVASVLEGIFSKSLARSIGYMTFSLLPLLDQVFVLYLMHQFDYGYVQAYYSAYTQQLMSLLALVVTGSTNIFGTNFAPPLSRYSFPIDPVMLASMIVSLAAVLFYFIFVRETRLRGEVFSGVASALMLGGILGFVVFYVIRLATPSGYQLFIAALALVITVLYAGRSTPERKARKKGSRKPGNDW